MITSTNIVIIIQEHLEFYGRHFKDEPAINAGYIIGFNAANGTNLFKIKAKITGETCNDGTKYVEIMVPLNYLSNFWRTHEIPLINCGISLDLNWSKECIIVVTAVKNQGATFSITDTKLDVPFVTLSTQCKTT